MFTIVCLNQVRDKIVKYLIIINIFYQTKKNVLRVFICIYYLKGVKRMFFFLLNF